LILYALWPRSENRLTGPSSRILLKSCSDATKT
jgi:hypothetical protein